MGKDVVIRHFIAKTNATYLYWGHSYYDPKGKCTRNVKRCIGKLNERDEFVPNKTFLSLPPDEQLATGLIDRPFQVTQVSPSKDDDIAAIVSSTKFRGWVALIERAAEEERLTESLRCVFPRQCTVLMDLLESSLTVDGTMYNFRKFHSAYWGFARKPISRREIDEALEDAVLLKERFFEVFGKARPAPGGCSVCAVDPARCFGWPELPGLDGPGQDEAPAAPRWSNVLVVCEEETGIPLSYRSVQGDLLDGSALAAALPRMRNAASGKETTLVLDESFWSGGNVERLASSGFGFVVCLPSTCSLFRDTLERARRALSRTACYIREIDRTCVVLPYEADAPRTGTDSPREMALYAYRDRRASLDRRKAAMLDFAMRLEELRADHALWNPKRSSFFGRYFLPVCDGEGRIVDFRHDEVAQARCKDQYGIHICLAPKGMDPVKVHRSHELRQRIEDGFGSSRKRDRRLGADGNADLEGCLFVDFLNSVVDSALRCRMRDYALDRAYTLDQIEDIVSSARFHVPQGKAFEEGRWIGLTAEQKTMLYSMGLTEMEDLYPGTAAQAEAEKQGRLEGKARRARSPKNP